MAVDIGAPSALKANRESFRLTFAPVQAGQLTAAVAVATYRSNSWPQPAQRYSYSGTGYWPPRWT